MFEFIFQIPIDEEALQWSLDVNTFEKMQLREKKNKEDFKGDPTKKGFNAFRVRRGKIGDYRSEMTKETLDFVNSYIRENLDSFYDFYKHE